MQLKKPSRPNASAAEAGPARIIINEAVQKKAKRIPPAHKVGVQQIGARKKAAGAARLPLAPTYKEIYLLISCAASTTPDITINASPHTHT